MRADIVRDARRIVVIVEGTERCGQQDISRRSEVCLRDANPFSYAEIIVPRTQIS